MAINNVLNESSTGIQSLTSSGSVSGVTVTGTSNQISVSNGNGTSGNPTLSLTSTIQVSGISFDSGSNTLSVYALGTFTPAITGLSTNPTVSYTTQVGRYTKIGTRAYLTFNVVVSSTSGGSGGIVVTSPFTIVNNNVGYVFIANTTFVASTIYIVSKASGGTTNILFASCKSGAASINNTVTNMTNTTAINVSMVVDF